MASSDVVNGIKQLKVMISVGFSIQVVCYFQLLLCWSDMKYQLNGI